MNISIIIPAYNYSKYVCEAIDSALNQSIPCEVIVVDDGSKDNTRELCNAYGNKIKYIYQDNAGLSAARNTGVRHSKGDYIICLDADDTIDPTYAEKCMNKMQEGYDIVCSQWLEYQDDENSNLPDYIRTIDTSHLAYDDFKVANRIICASMFKKEYWGKIGGFDENMKFGYEDFSAWRQMTKIGAKVGVVPEVLFFYRKHGKSMINGSVEKHEMLMKYMDEKGY